MTNALGRLKAAVVPCAILLLQESAHAHGPQIQIGLQDNAIVTHSLFADEPYDDTLTPIQRVYEIPMAQRSLGDANDGWYSQPNIAYPWTGPGIATALGGFATGSVLSLTFTDGLKIWNGAGFIDPGDEQIDAYRDVTHTAGAITSDTGPFDDFNFTPIAGSADEHKHTFYRLLGNGVAPNTPSDDGVYLLSLRLTSAQPGVNPSAPYYFLLNKNASPAEAAAALAYLNNSIGPAVPVSSQWSVALLSLALLAVAVIRVPSRGQAARGKSASRRESRFFLPDRGGETEAN